MKTPDLIAVVLAAPTAAWYLFSADTPQEFVRHAITLACVGALIAFVLIFSKEPPNPKGPGATRAFPDDIDA